MPMFQEAGVTFSHDESYTDNAQREGGEVFTYHWEHVPSQRKGTRKVWVLTGARGFLKLLAHWNRQPGSDWHHWFDGVEHERENAHGDCG